MRFFGKLFIWILMFLLYGNVSGYVSTIPYVMYRQGAPESQIMCYEVISLIVTLGGLVLAIFLSIKISRQWEKVCCKRDVAIINRKAAAEGKSRRDYLKEHMPKNIIEICEHNYREKELMEVLSSQVDYKVISKGTACALVEEFGIKQ